MDYVVAIFMVLGAFFAFVAALGVYRMPDFFMRMHAATKAGAFGASLMVCAAALHFGSLRVAIMAISIIILFYITTPVAAQTLGETAYRKGVKLWEKTKDDQLAADEKGTD